MPYRTLVVCSCLQHQYADRSQTTVFFRTVLPTNCQPSPAHKPIFSDNTPTVPGSSPKDLHKKHRKSGCQSIHFPRNSPCWRSLCVLNNSQWADIWHSRPRILSGNSSPKPTKTNKLCSFQHTRHSSFSYMQRHWRQAYLPCLYTVSKMCLLLFKGIITLMASWPLTWPGNCSLWPVKVSNPETNNVT